MAATDPLPPHPILTGSNVVLRGPIESDKTDRLRFGRDPEYHRMVGGDPRETSTLTHEGMDRWYQRALREPLHWVIDLDRIGVGTARLHAIDDANRRARYAVGIYDPTKWGRGLGTEVTNLVLKYAFDELKLHRVDLKVLSFNERAIRCDEKCGFVKEGIEREGALISGQWQSDIFMSIFEHEYRRRHGRSS